MGLTPEWLDSCGAALFAIYAGAEDAILAEMARRIVQYDYFIPSAEHQQKVLDEMGYTQEFILAELSKRTKLTQVQLVQLMQDAGMETVRSDRKIYQQAGISVPEQASEAVQNLLAAGYRQTAGRLVNLTGTTARTGGDQLRRELDSAWLQVTLGGMSPQEAVGRAIKRLSASGLESVSYASGRRMGLDSVVRMTVRTGVNQTAMQVQLQLANELGSDLVEVTAHAGARPDHAVWQGQVYSLSGNHPKYKKLEEATGYGTVTGLGGANCRHNFFPYFEGTASAYSKQDLEDYTKPDAYTYNGKQLSEYEAAQLQRYHERQIRKWKREYTMTEAAGLDTTESAVKLRSWQERQKDFLQQTGLRLQSARQESVGFGRSQAGKANAIVAKYKKIRYHKDGTIVVTDDWKERGKVSIPRQYYPNAVIETQTEFKNGTIQIDRTIYDAEGVMVKQIHSGDHNRPDKHPYGDHGEHAHDYIWDDSEKHPNRDTRDITPQERIEHKDLLGGEKIE